MSAFEDLHEIGPSLLADGYVARAVHGEALTFAVVEIAAGAELPEHGHGNEQFGMIIEGTALFEIGDEQRTLGPGAIWKIPSDTLHKVTGGPEGAVVIDVFSPRRDDWMRSEQLPNQKPIWP